MHKRLMAVAVFIVVVSAPTLRGGSAVERSFWIAQFADGSFQGDRFSTTINFINLSTTVSSVTVSTFGDNGDPLDLLQGDMAPFDPVSERTLVIEGRGTATLPSNSDGDLLLTGYARATTANAVGLEVIFNLFDPAGNLITATNVRIIPLVTALSFFGRATTGARTGAAFLNPLGGPTDIELTLFNADGTIRGTDMFTLQEGQKSSRFLDEFIQGLSNFVGSVEVRSDEPISVLPLRQEGVILTTQDAFPPRQLDN